MNINPLQIKIPQILEPLLLKGNNLSELLNSRKSCDFFKKSSISQIQGNIYDNMEYIVEEIQRIQKQIFKQGKKLLNFDNLTNDYEQHIAKIQSDQNIMINVIHEQERIKESLKQKQFDVSCVPITVQKQQTKSLTNSSQTKKFKSFFDDYLSSEEEDLALFK
ncbi:AH/BAR_domain superfamily [Hexamita inflata]|uniref:AH/BAR domain superfamily n=1 Tax=Hexamita inflata TaxID=28002 RepID=A0AA86Q5K2_9EUKA|nr:AH/BAR domain superfamily [Hexamita inflata]